MAKISEEEIKGGLPELNRWRTQPKSNHKQIDWIERIKSKTDYSATAQENEPPGQVTQWCLAEPTHPILPIPLYPQHPTPRTTLYTTLPRSTSDLHSLACFQY